MQQRAPILDLDADPGRTVLVCSARGSGAAWVAAIANHAGTMRPMFEPFDSDRVAVARAFGRLLHLAPGAPAPEHEDAADAVMSGRIRDPRVDRFTRPGTYARRLVRDASCHLFLGWLADRYPSSPVVLLLRHPFSTLLARHAAADPSRGTVRDLLAQERLCETHLAAQVATLERAQPGFEADLCVWAAQHRVALREAPAGRIALAFHESLEHEPDVAVPALLAAVGQPRPEGSGWDTLVAAWQRPSPAHGAGPPGRRAAGSGDWRAALDATARRRARAILDAFGLDGLYREDGTPDADAARSLRASAA